MIVLVKVMVPEDAFRDNALLVTSSDATHPPVDRVGSFWKQLEGEALEVGTGLQ